MQKKIESYLAVTETVWSNSPLHLILERGDEINGVALKACCPEKHTGCARRKACEERTPVCDLGWHALIGKEYHIEKGCSYAKMERIKALGRKVLRADFQRCQPVKLQLISEVKL